MEGFLKRHTHLKGHALQSIEVRGKAEVRADQICERIARLCSAIVRYNIRSPRYVINIDESGVSFKEMNGRKRIFSVGPPEAREALTCETHECGYWHRVNLQTGFLISEKRAALQGSWVGQADSSQMAPKLLFFISEEWLVSTVLFFSEWVKPVWTRWLLWGVVVIICCCC